MKKHIANIITGSRIVFSLPLLFVPLSSVWFYVLYLFCGLTDMIDGTIARKTGAVSEFGARLDTVSDFVFLSVCLIKLLPLMDIPVWLWVWIAFVGAVKIGNLTGGFVRTKTLVPLHTVMNKITGFLLFLLPLTFPVIDLKYSIIAVCAIASLAAIQESIYIAAGYKTACAQKETFMKYQIIRLMDKPEMKEQMANWFSEKWSVPLQAYLDSMEDCLRGTKHIPQWYIAMDGSQIIGGLGVIENDFHSRKDLTPNVCAVYTEPDRRSQGVAGTLLRYVCGDMKQKGIDTLYLVTDHTAFYERYGWEFLCMVQSDGETDLSRMYVHRTR